MQPRVQQARAHQLVQLVVGLQAPQQAAELMVVAVLSQPRLSLEDVPGAGHERIEKARARLLAGKQRPPHRGQPHLGTVQASVYSVWKGCMSAALAWQCLALLLWLRICQTAGLTRHSSAWWLNGGWEAL